MFPERVALVDDDAEFSEYLGQHLAQHDVQVQVFADSGSLLADHDAYEFGFYIVDLSLPGIDGVELIRVLRRRTNAGVLVVSGRLAPDVFESVVNAGADMYLAKPVTFDQVMLAIRAVHRRAVTVRETMFEWRLDEKSNELVTPDGARVSLSETDLAVMQCFLQANGDAVTQATLRQKLGRASATTDTADNALHATIYRLRRRIEKATPMVVPLQSLSRVGYVFKAKLSPA